MATPAPVALDPPGRRAAERFSPFAVPRSPREWVVDGALFVLSLLLVWASASPRAYPEIPAWFWPVDLLLGVAASLLVWWTRRFPLLCALLLLVPGSLAVTAGLTALVGIYRLALLGRPATAVLVTALHVACAIPYHALMPIPDIPWLVWVVLVPLLYGLVLCLGLLGRARRQVIEGLRLRAVEDRERYEQRLGEIRREEREGIAREMHDVLAHRISLLSVHAGALEFRAGSTAGVSVEEVREAASVIRESARLAVEDLRELLGLLRTDEDALTTGRPQPTLRDLDGLVREAATAGQRVDLVVGARVGEVRESLQRTTYRVVQEAITNARKHAPASRVDVTVTGGGTSGVQVRVDNPVPVGVTDADRGHGSGLVGLAERVRLDGGRLTAGVVAGRFRVDVHLPAEGR